MAYVAMALILFAMSFLVVWRQAKARAEAESARDQAELEAIRAAGAASAAALRAKTEAESREKILALRSAAHGDATKKGRELAERESALKERSNAVFAE